VEANRAPQEPRLAMTHCLALPVIAMTDSSGQKQSARTGRTLSKACLCRNLTTRSDKKEIISAIEKIKIIDCALP
jgi:hypothetical protein